MPGCQGRSSAARPPLAPRSWVETSPCCPAWGSAPPPGLAAFEQARSASAVRPAFGWARLRWGRRHLRQDAPKQEAGPLDPPSALRRSHATAAGPGSRRSAATHPSTASHCTTQTTCERPAPPGRLALARTRRLVSGPPPRCPSRTRCSAGAGVGGALCRRGRGTCVVPAQHARPRPGPALRLGATARPPANSPIAPD
eukprot:scaffold3296_cov405-Prasinococcus_capsulatus_cf.AAC.16